MRARLRPLTLLAARLAAAGGALGACTFPDYLPVLDEVAGASSGGSAGSDAAGASTGATGASAGSTGGGGTASGAAGATDNEGGEAGSSPQVTPEFGVCGQRAYPQHCLNHQRDEDETDVDCGGPACERCAADEACTRNLDCATGACTGGKCPRLFELQYLQMNPDEETSSPRLQVKLTYLGSEQILLSDVAVRYYFSRNGVSEPLLTGGSTLQLPGGADISGATTRQIVRQLRGDGISNDAFLEIGFSGSTVLSQGDGLDIQANINAGDDNSPFNQTTHHSWDDQTSLHESKKLTVHRGSRRVWGRGPAIDNPPSCLHVGVNLDGDTVQIDGEDWLKSPDSPLDRYIDNGVALRPPVSSKGLEEMLRAGFFFNDTSFTYPVDSGDYALLVYAWSASGGEIGTLRLLGETKDRFHAQSSEGGGPWVALGPYRISVDDGMLELGAQGILRVGGFELRKLDELE